MERLNSSPVTADQIDSLGHLNVRFYVSRMDQANRSLLVQQGIAPGKGQALRRVDTYNKFRREQFEGAILETWGGLIEPEPGFMTPGFTGYYEIRYVDTGDVAASFLAVSQLINAETQAIEHNTECDQAFVSAAKVSVPSDGLPRSLSLDMPGDVSLDTLLAAIPEDIPPGNMTGRRENVVLPEDCDPATGRLHEETDLMSIVFRPMPNEPGAEAMGPPIQRDDEGRRYAWAMMETRSIVRHYPRAGDAVLALSGDIAFGEKWRQTRRWMFVPETGRLLGISDSLAICIDLDQRRAISMPQDVRDWIGKTCVPHLA